jgi:hypothetical protein
MGLTMIYDGGARGEAVEACEFCGSYDLNMLVERTGERFKRAVVYRFEASCPAGHLRLIIPRMTMANQPPRRSVKVQMHNDY